MVYLAFSIIALTISVICYMRVRALNNEFESIERRIYGNIKFNSFYLQPTREQLEKAERYEKILKEYKSIFEDKE